MKTLIGLISFLIFNCGIILKAGAQDFQSTNTAQLNLNVFGKAIVNEEKSNPAYYVIQQFDALYQQELSKLSSWERWQRQLAQLNTPAKAAYEGLENLHLYRNEIEELAHTYQQLKAEMNP